MHQYAERLIPELRDELTSLLSRDVDKRADALGARLVSETDTLRQR